jgi:phosphatidylserine synthase
MKKSKKSTNKPQNFEYQKSLKKPSQAFGISLIKFVDMYINRPLAGWLVRAVFKTRITPNGITYVSFIVGMVGAYFFTRGRARDFIIAGVLTQLASIIDGADGMLARAKNMCSEYGSHLDLFFDRITDFCVFACIGVGASLYFRNPQLLYLGFLPAGLYMFRINLFYLPKVYQQNKERGNTGEARALLMWAVLIFAVVNRLDIFIYLLLAQTIITDVSRTIFFISLGRKR